MAVKEIKPNDFEVVLKFGGGINSRASETDINDRDAVSGQNFDLDLENNEWRPRPSIDLAGTAPNAGAINGFAQLRKRDGTLSTLIQAGTNVYLWDGAGAFTLVGTVAAGTKLRGPSAAMWELDEKILIADLALVQPVMEWDGTTLSNTVFSGVTGAFKARYIFVDRERAHFCNVESNSVATPHMIVGSSLSDYTTLSITQRPSSALSEADPWFLLTPDLRYINGVVGAFNVITVSSQKGSMWQITGASAKDFAISALYSGSSADGAEAIAYIGNDVAYARTGRIESLSGTQNFGDVETDDLSRQISNSIESFGGWVIVYNSRTQKVFFFPDGESELWVLHKPILDETKRLRSTVLAPTGQPDLSPWSKWTTQHAMAFQPTAVMAMQDPQNSLDAVFMGDALGNIYRLEGEGDGDVGQDIISTRTSKLFSVPMDADVFDMEGYVQFRKGDAATLTITILWAGSTPTTQVLTIPFGAVDDAAHYNGSAGAADPAYYNGSAGAAAPVHYGSPTRGKFVRKIFAPAGQATTFQVKTEITGQTDFDVSEVGLRFTAASP